MNPISSFVSTRVPQVVQTDLDCFIELLFRESKAYCLALKLNARRYEVIGVRDAIA